MAETKTNVQYLDMEGLSLYDSLIKAKIATDIDASEYDDTALKGRVSANESAITVLNGEGEGSVKKQVNDAVAKIVADAPEAYNTLKEISDWISSHAEDASAMNSQISTNKSDIAALKTLIGTLPESAESSTIVAYIAETIGASQTDLTTAIATAKSEAISTAATDATTKANKALADAKDYADGLANNYATAEQGTKADTAVQSVASGTANGTISVDGTDVAVKGLGDAAYTDASAYEKAGAVKGLADGQVATNTTDISTLKTKVETLESTTYVAITEAEINALFE